MTSDMTLEQISSSFLSVQNEIDRAQETLEGLLVRMDDRIGQLQQQGVQISVLDKEMENVKKQATSLMKKVDQIQSKLAVLDLPSILE